MMIGEDEGGHHNNISTAENGNARLPQNGGDHHQDEGILHQSIHKSSMSILFSYSDEEGRVCHHEYNTLMQWGVYVGLFFSLIFFGTIMSWSATKHTYTSSLGETFRLPAKSIFTKDQVKLQVNNNDDYNQNYGYAKVYVFNKCPSLTGDAITHQLQYQLTLHPDDYEYDYFRLYSGSTIDFNITVQEGEVQVSLLAMKYRWEEGSAAMLFADGDIKKRVKYQRFASAGDELSIHHLNRHEKVYVLVYENIASGKNSTIDLDLTVVSTTYNLQDSTPSAFLEANNEDDIVTVEATRCVIVAPSTTGNDDDGGGNGEFYLSATYSRRWAAIFMASAIPFLIGWVASKTLVKDDFAKRLRKSFTGSGEEMPSSSTTTAHHDYYRWPEGGERGPTTTTTPTTAAGTSNGRL